MALKLVPPALVGWHRGVREWRCGAVPVMGIAKFERFFRKAASLDVDKNDLKRYSDFVDMKTYDMLVVGKAVANANGRDIVEPHDLPITKGLQEGMHEFEKLDEEIDVSPLLERLASPTPPDITPSEATIAKLPFVAGGLSLALARTFKVLDPGLKNPQTEHWERAFEIFGNLL